MCWVARRRSVVGARLHARSGGAGGAPCSNKSAFCGSARASCLAVGSSRHWQVGRDRKLPRPIPRTPASASSKRLDISRQLRAAPLPLRPTRELAACGLRSDASRRHRARAGRRRCHAVDTIVSALRRCRALTRRHRRLTRRFEPRSKSRVGRWWMGPVRVVGRVPVIASSRARRARNRPGKLAIPAYLPACTQLPTPKHDAGAEPQKADLSEHGAHPPPPDLACNSSTRARLCSDASPRSTDHAEACSLALISLQQHCNPCTART